MSRELCREFYREQRELVAACGHHAKGIDDATLVLADQSHDEFLRDRALERSIDVPVRAESECGAVCLALPREQLLALLAGADDGDVAIVRERLRHARGRPPLPLLILHRGQFLFVQPGGTHGTA